VVAFSAENRVHFSGKMLQSRSSIFEERYGLNAITVGIANERGVIDRAVFGSFGPVFHRIAPPAATQPQEASDPLAASARAPPHANRCQPSIGIIANED